MPYIILSKENVRKIGTGTFFSCVLRPLKGFCMANLAVYLDVNIALSKNRFNGVAYFEIVRLSLRKMIFFANIYLPSTLHDKLNSLKEPSTFKG